MVFYLQHCGRTSLEIRFGGLLDETVLCPRPRPRNTMVATSTSLPLRTATTKRGSPRSAEAWHQGENLGGMHKSTVCQLLELEIVEPDLHKRDVAVGILDQVPQSLAL